MQLLGYHIGMLLYLLLCFLPLAQPFHPPFLASPLPPHARARTAALFAAKGAAPTLSSWSYSARTNAVTGTLPDGDTVTTSPLDPAPDPQEVPTLTRVSTESGSTYLLGSPAAAANNPFPEVPQSSLSDLVIGGPEQRYVLLKSRSKDSTSGKSRIHQALPLNPKYKRAHPAADQTPTPADLLSAEPLTVKTSYAAAELAREAANYARVQAPLPRLLRAASLAPEAPFVALRLHAPRMWKNDAYQGFNARASVYFANGETEAAIVLESGREDLKQ